MFFKKYVIFLHGLLKKLKRTRNGLQNRTAIF